MTVAGGPRSGARDRIGGRETPGPRKVERGCQPVPRHRQDRDDGFQRARRPLRVPQRSLGRAHRHAVVAGKRLRDPPPFCGVVGLRAGAVRVHVAHLRRRQRRIGESRNDGPAHPAPVRVRGRLVVAVGRKAIPRQHSPRGRLPPAGRVRPFQHHEPRPLAQRGPEGVAERSALPRRQDPQGVESSEHFRRQDVGPAGDHDVGAGSLQEVARDTDRRGRGGARRGDGHGGAAHAERVGQRLRQLVDRSVLVGQSRAEHQADPLRRHAADSCIQHRLSGGPEGEPEAPVPGGFGRIRAVPVRHLGAGVHVELDGVEAADPPDAIASALDRVEQFRMVASDGAHRPHARDDAVPGRGPHARLSRRPERWPGPGADESARPG